MTYCFLVTLTWNPLPNRNLMITRETDGTVTATDGGTRLELTRDVIKAAKEALGANDTATVVFLSIEPNEL